MTVRVRKVNATLRRLVFEQKIWFKASISCITKLKEPGDPSGGRIFLYRGPRDEVQKTVDYLERSPVIVDLPRSESDRFDSLRHDIDAIRRQGLYRTPRPAPRAAHCAPGTPLVDFSSNDYLGLARDPEVKAAADYAAVLV